MTSETVPVVVGVLGLIRERMDQNLGKIRGVSDIARWAAKDHPPSTHKWRTYWEGFCPSNKKTPVVPHQDQGLDN